MEQNYVTVTHCISEKNQSTNNSIAGTNQNIYRVRRKIGASPQLRSQVGTWLARRRQRKIFAMYITKQQINIKNSTTAGYQERHYTPSMLATFNT